MYFIVRFNQQMTGVSDWLWIVMKWIASKYIIEYVIYNDRLEQIILGLSIKWWDAYESLGMV